MMKKLSEEQNKTAVAYIIAAGIALVAVALAVALVRWPGPFLEVLGAGAAVYLFHLLAQAVRASLP